MIVIAHRGNHEGVNKLNENNVHSLSYCLRRGWGIETDIRRAKDGTFYISHDPTGVSDTNRADVFCEVFRGHPGSTIALNVKELGYEEHLVQFLSSQQMIPQAFLFDMELLEQKPGESAFLLRQLNSHVRIAARVSDRGETIEQALRIKSAEIIWMDEFEKLWITRTVVDKLKAAGKSVYAVSPEIHDFPKDIMHRRWFEFHKWGVDGVCTDYAEALDDSITNKFKLRAV